MPSDKSRLVTVLTAFDETVLAAAKSLLDEAGIEYFSKGEDLQNLFGSGTLGPIELQVEEHKAGEAKKILAELKSE